MASPELTTKATALFEKRYGYHPKIGAFAPGRVNLIGEHTDYCEGFVLPMALEKQTVIVGSGQCKLKVEFKKDPICRITSELCEDLEEFRADSTLCPQEPKWANYVKGVVAEYLGDIPAGYALQFDIAIVSDVPLGGGLSSSAALEVATATFLEALLKRTANVEPPTRTIKALRCQSCEHKFCSTPCGIMDQFISALAEEGKLLLIDCRSQVGTPAKMNLPKCGGKMPVVLVCNSNVKHSLASEEGGEGEYAKRVRQCKEAVEAMQRHKKAITSLRDANMEDVQLIKSDVADVIFRRAHHVVSENERCQATAAALEHGDYELVGKSMIKSHESLKRDYEVSCKELDILVDIANSVEGVYGCRMTGGGFGGCTVALVDPDAVVKLENELKRRYLEETGKHCTTFVTAPGTGTGEIELHEDKTPALFVLYAAVMAILVLVTAIAIGAASLK